MTVLIAPDKFKGSLTAAEVAAAVAAGISGVCPEIPVRSLPVADGGEGTVDAVVSAGFRRVRTVVTGPAGSRSALRWRCGTTPRWWNWPRRRACTGYPAGRFP